jgi:ABC-type spermidine/putrescine transport system permease subunit I
VASPSATVDRVTAGSGTGTGDGRGPGRAWSPHAGRVLGLLLAAPVIALLVLFVVMPVVQVFVDASSGGAGLTRYLDVFRSEVSRRALVTTLVDSVIVTAVTVALAGVLAWMLHTTQRGWLRLLIWLTALVPFAMGMIVKNYAVLLLLVANGPVNAILLGLGITDEPVPLLYTTFAVVYGVAYSLLPYAVLTLYSVISTVDKDLLACASVLGASRGRVLVTVVWPLVRGGVLVASALVFVLSIGFYVTPILLGGLQTPFIATVINQEIFSLLDYPAAAATSAVILLIALAVLGLALALGGGQTFRKVLR